MTVTQFHAKHRVRKSLGYYTILFYCILFGHIKRVAKLVIYSLKINILCLTGHTTFQLTTATHESIVLSHQQIAFNLL